MTATIKKLYLATVTDGVVDFERPAEDADVEALGWVRIEQAYSKSLAHAMKQEQGGVYTVPLATIGTNGNGELTPIVVNHPPTVAILDSMRQAFGAFHDVVEAMDGKPATKEPNGSNGHGEARDTERPPRKKPSDRLRELLTAGPPKVHGSAFAAVDWALEIVGTVLDEQEK